MENSKLYSDAKNNKSICIHIDDAVYPERIKLVLGKKAPKKLYTIGNKQLLNAVGVGFCGSRNASEKGLETAKDCAWQFSQNNITVISGNANGVDFEAHYHTLKNGGKTIFVLPEGINHFKIKKSLEDVWDWNRVLVLSQFEPNETWQAFRAMIRNQLIIALSHVMIVIEAGDKGGTLNAGKETLKLGIPLFVAEYQDMSNDAIGNKMLLNMGGNRLAKSQSTNQANLTKIVEYINNGTQKMILGVKQSTLFDL